MKRRLHIWKALASFFVMLQVFISAMIPLQAGVRVEMASSGIRIMADSFEGGTLMMKTYNGLPAYCIEPRVDFSKEDVYDVSYFEQYQNLSASQREHIAEFSYFGYGYDGHSSPKDYAASQYLIWLEIDDTFVRNVTYYDEASGSQMTSDVEASIQRILSDVNEYQKETVFNVSGAVNEKNIKGSYYGTGTAGTDFFFDDISGALCHMKLAQNDFGDALAWSNNHVSIHLSSATAGEKRAKFISNTLSIGDRPLLLSDASGQFQKFFVRGDISRTALIQLHTLFTADLSKTDPEGRRIAGASFQLYDKTADAVIDTWISEQEAHHISGLEGDHVYVLSEEGAPVGYYYGNEISFQPERQTDISLADRPIRCSILKADENGLPVSGAQLQLIDQTDGRSLTFISTQDPYECGSFLKADHSYAVKELQAPIGCYAVQDIEFSVTHNDERPIQIIMKDPHINYEIIKKDEAGKPVKGASLSLYDVSSKEKELLKTWITGIEPMTIGDLLKAGHSYSIVENDAASKYFLAVDQNFTVSQYAEETERHEITVIDDHIRYVLQKVDENGKAVKDARLLITDITDPLDADRVVLDWHSTEEPLTINMFERGHTYRLQEIEGPDGYYLAADQIFTVPDHGDANPIVITCEDDHIVYSFLKTDTAGEPIENAELKIYEKTEQGEKEIRSFLSKKNAELIYGLKRNTDYVLKETKAPLGFYAASEIPFHTDEQGTAAPIAVVMEDQKIQAVLVKNDPAGRRVAGAVLEVKDHNTGQQIGTFQTSADADIEIGSLLQADHTYDVQEIAAPNGYYKAEAQVFTASSSEPSAIRIVMEDALIHASVKKTDLLGQTVPGAHLSLIHAEEILDQWISEDVPHDISSYLHAGEKYEIREDQPPQGYYAAEPIPFTISDTAAEETEISVKDMPIQYEILKTDEQGTPVPGVMLRLSDVTVPETQLIREWTTAETSEKFGRELCAGHQYLLEETALAAGYQEAESLRFTVSEKGIPQAVTVRMIDETNDISFLKTDEAGNPLADAEIEIQDKDGNVITSFLSDGTLKGITLDRMGKKISSYLIGGETYILHEKKAPFGYDLCADQIFQMTGTLAQPQVISLLDRPKAVYLQIDKRSADGSMPYLADCEITVYHAGTDEPALDLNGDKAQQLTAEKGIVSFRLPYTSDGYYVKETKAPDGYAIDPKEIPLSNDQEEFFHQESPQEIHVFDHKNVDTGTDLPYHAVMALLCAFGCLCFMKYPHEKA
jgi:uncharacterized surface anchored protein